MNGSGVIRLIACLLVGTSQAFAEQGSTPSAAKAESGKAPPTTIKYKKGKDVRLDQTTIQGEIKRPELNVVTGSREQWGDGLLRLRENFHDRMAAESGLSPVAQDGAALPAGGVTP